jgi:hypothetical protein
LDVHGVRHRQTGTRWTTHRYENVDEAGSNVTEKFGPAGDGNFPTAGNRWALAAKPSGATTHRARFTLG